MFAVCRRVGSGRGDDGGGGCGGGGGRGRLRCGRRRRLRRERIEEIEDVTRRGGGGRRGGRGGGRGGGRRGRGRHLLFRRFFGFLLFGRTLVFTVGFLLRFLR